MKLLSRNRELTVLNEISKNISEAFDIDIILSVSLKNILKLTNMECGGAYLFDEKTDQFTMINHQGREGCYDNFEPKKTTEVLIVEGVKNNESSMDNYISYAIIPLKSKDQVLGIISIN